MGFPSTKIKMRLLCEKPRCAQPATAALARGTSKANPDASVRYDILRAMASRLHEFHGHFARASDARPLEMPIRCLINWTIMDIVRELCGVESSLPK